MANDQPTMEIFEMFQKMVNPMAFPMQNLLMGTLKLEELEKKISELKTVQHWLNTNVGMLDLTIKTLEYQRALLAPADAAQPAAAAPLAENPLFNPALWPWSFTKPEGTGATKTEPAPQPGPGAKAAPRKRG